MKKKLFDLEKESKEVQKARLELESEMRNLQV